MQSDELSRALKEVTADTPVLVNALPGLIHHGTRAPKGAIRPFGLMTIAEVEREENTASVALVTYEVTLQVVVNEQIGGPGGAGTILRTFHRYWDRLRSLPDGILDPDYARFVLIRPLGETEIGEADEKEFGKDVILGTTSWHILLSEHSPEL